MGDNNGCPALGGLVEGPHDAVLGDGVQAGGRLVKHQDGRVLENGPGYGHPLLLPSTELEASLPHLGVVTTGPVQNADNRSQNLNNLSRRMKHLRR